MCSGKLFQAHPGQNQPDGNPADQTKKVQVFILLGQSNMLGFGRVGPKETKGSLIFIAC